MTNHRIIYDSYWTNNLRGVVLTKYNYIEIEWKCNGPITLTKIVKSKWQENMKAIRPMTSEELHSQCITIVKINENVTVPKLQQKSTNQNGSIYSN